MVVGFWLLVIGLMSFLVFGFRFLMVLLTFEMLMFSCFSMFIFLIGGLNYFLEMILFLMMIVGAGAYGLSLLVYVSHGIGMDMVLEEEY